MFGSGLKKIMFLSFLVLAFGVILWAPKALADRNDDWNGQSGWGRAYDDRGYGWNGNGYDYDGYWNGPNGGYYNGYGPGYGQGFYPYGSYNGYGGYGNPYSGYYYNPWMLNEDR